MHALAQKLKKKKIQFAIDNNINNCSIYFLKMTSEETYIGAIDEGTSSTRFMVCFIENTTEL